MSYAFRLSQHSKRDLIWNETCIYYDVETAPWDKPFQDIEYLDIRRHGLTAFTLLVPKDLVPKRGIPYDAIVKEIMIEGVAFKAIQYYNDQNKGAVQTMLFEVLDVIAKHLKRTTYLCGFNNDHFDDLIILDRLSEDTNRWRYHLPDRASKLYTTDLLPWARAYGFHKLADLGDYLGIPKLTGWTTLQEYLDYNIRDTEILLHFVKLLNTHGFYSLRPATEARRMISREFHRAMLDRYGVEITRIFSDERISDKIPLFGGRTEPYYAVGENVHCLDINSLYPYVMSTFEFPKIQIRHTYREGGKIYSTAEIKHLEHTCSPRMQYNIRQFLDRVGEYIRIKAKACEPITPDMLREYFEANSPWFGVLFVKLHGIRPEWKQYEQQILFYFPFARKSGAYTLFSYDPDATYCVQFYELTWLCFFDYEIVDAIHFPYHEQLPIADEIHALYDKRKEAKARGDSIERAYKLLLNSGFGILATREYKEQAITEQHEVESCLKLWRESGDKQTITAIDSEGRRFMIKVRTSGDIVQFSRLVGDPNRRYAKNTIPIIAIAITSHARFTLYSLMLNSIITYPLIAEKYRIYYVDTDSIFCSRELAEHLQVWIGPGIGQLKEEAVYKRCIFLAPKTYIAETDDGQIMRFKGTGAQFVRTIVVQSKTSEFRTYERQALNPDNLQKRYLSDELVFLPTAQPQPGSPALHKLWNYVESA